MFLLHNRLIIIVYLNNFQHKRKGKHTNNAVTELLSFYSSGYSIILFSILNDCAMITFLFFSCQFLKHQKYLTCSYANF